MRLNESIKPISYLKAHAAEVLKNVVSSQQPLIITQHGEAKVVVQDVASYDRTQESLAMLKMLAISSEHLKQGKYRPVSEAFSNIQQRIDRLNKS